MKLAWSQSRAMLAAAALVLVSNAIALGGVAYNRGGEPESVLQLTERELPIQRWSWPDNENSAIHLRLSWRVPGTYRGLYRDDDVEWLTPEQLRELGFDTPPPRTDPDKMEHYDLQPPRKVFFALEYDGPAYREALEQSRAELRAAETQWATALSNKELSDRVESAKFALNTEQTRASRLFVVAADLDPRKLRQRYPDRKHYAIVRGELDVYSRGAELTARVRGISTAEIRVPHVYRSQVEPYLAEAYVTEREPRYTATVRIGRRLEPWIVQLSATQ
jgi:hypothetical protein